MECKQVKADSTIARTVQIQVAFLQVHVPLMKCLSSYRPRSLVGRGTERYLCAIDGNNYYVIIWQDIEMRGRIQMDVGLKRRPLITVSPLIKSSPD